MQLSKIGRFMVGILLMFGLLTPVASQTSGFNVDKRYVHVMQGQTVFKLVMSLYPDYKDHWLDIVDSFVELNPQAFHDRDADRIIVGARMEVPRELPTMGTVTDLSGQAYRTNVFGKRIALTPGSVLHVGDEVVTAEGAEAVIDAKDKARFFLRKRARFSIVEYKLADADEDNRSVLQLLQGSLRAITGEIGARSPQHFALNTPMATIGVRGTDFAVRVCEPGQCQAVPELDIDAAPGVYVSVLKGAIEVGNNAGGRDVLRGDYFYVPEVDKAPQRLYEKPRLVFNETELALLPSPVAAQSAAPVAAAPVVVAPVAESPKSASVSWLFMLLLVVTVLRLWLNRSERNARD